MKTRILHVLITLSTCAAAFRCARKIKQGARQLKVNFKFTYQFKQKRNVFKTFLCLASGQSSHSVHIMYNYDYFTVILCTGSSAITR